MTPVLRRTLALAILSTAIAATGLAGCVVEPQRGVVEVVAPQAPPPPRVEIVPAAPRPPEFVVWEPGHWHWNGREFVWVAGHYVERPRREAEWIQGGWQERGPNWVWVGGHWR
jgi:hypothetical protein